MLQHLHSTRQRLLRLLVLVQWSNKVLFISAPQKKPPFQCPFMPDRHTLSTVPLQPARLSLYWEHKMANGWD